MTEFKNQVLPLVLLGLAGLFLLLNLAFPFFGTPESSPGLPPAVGPDEGTQEQRSADLPSDRPRRIGLQAGHWRVEELPPSMKELRDSVGAQDRGVKEVDINLDITQRTAELLRAAGWTVEVFGATVPPGYQAEAFVALHADWGQDRRRRGWKLAPPWRPSPASLELDRALRREFYAQGWPEDDENITVNMRGYYAFNHRYYEYAISPTTPAVLVELGYLTNDLDLQLLTGSPEKVAEVLARGILTVLQKPWTDAQLQEPTHPPVVVGPAGASLRRKPLSGSPQTAELAPGTRLFVLQRQEGWREVFLSQPQGVTGWVSDFDLR